MALKLLIPLCFLITLLDPFIICLGSFTREYTAVFIAITLSVILMNPGKKYILTGILVGLTFFTQQEEILAIIPFAIFHLCTHENNPLQFKWNLFLQRGLKMLLGFSFVLIPLLMWLFLNGALLAFWEQAFIYNFFIYRPNNPITVRLSNSLQLFYHSRIGFFILGSIMLHFYFIIKKNNRIIHLTVLITILMFAVLKSLFSRLGEMYNMQHYFMGYSALFAISALLILKELTPFFKHIYWKSGALALFLISSWFLWENALTSSFTVKEDRYYKRMHEILPYIQEIKNKDGQLFVFRNTAYIMLYNELNCLSPSKWIFTTTYNSKLNVDTAEKFVSEIIDSIESKQTQYIVDLSVEYPLGSLTKRLEWNNYLYSNYFIIKSAEGYTLLKRIQTKKRK